MINIQEDSFHTLKQGLLEKLVHILPLHYLTITYELHFLTAANHIPWFPWLLWLYNGSNYETHCFTSMASIDTQEWPSYHGHKT
jgi:hypothetical protein